jgi:hypothetical protein|tara:strand:+ start:3074 stop:3640 length:567 start_codon:yes stop_codon:yes gene_type:complete
LSKEANPLKGIVNIPRFGLFVITAGITAAGSLGLPETSILSLLPANILNAIDSSGAVIVSEEINILLTIIPGFILAPFIAFFGMAAIFGITLGHLVIATTSKIGAIDLFSPLFTFLGLFFIRQYKKPGNIIGPLIFVLLTSFWLSFVGVTVTGLDILPIFIFTVITQLGLVSIGYILYLIAKQIKLFE